MKFTNLIQVKNLFVFFYMYQIKLLYLVIIVKNFIISSTLLNFNHFLLIISILCILLNIIIIYVFMSYELLFFIMLAYNFYELLFAIMIILEDDKNYNLYLYDKILA
jgi:hypothetical protein